MLFLQANNATLNAHTKPMVKAAKNAATVRMVEVVTTFQELVLAHPDGEVLCKYHIYSIIFYYISKRFPIISFLWFISNDLIIK